MATYIVLIDFTGQGVQGVKDSPARADAFKRSAEQKGVHVREIYWTVGGHDGVLILEGPDETAVAAAVLSLARLGSVRTHTLRAFGRSEVESIIALSED